MKNLFKGVLLLSSFLVTSCSSTNSGNNSGETPSLSPLAQSIQNLRKSFTFEGNLVQTRQFYTDDTFKTPVTSGYEESDLRSESNLTFYFGEDSFRRSVTVKDATSGEYVPYLDETYFADENDYAYSEYLTYQNTIGRDYLTDTYNKFSMHGAGFNNPFVYIYESDFTENEDGTYSLNKSKASEMFVKLCYFFTTGAENPAGDAKATINSKGEITSITYSPTTRYVVESDTVSQQTLFYSIDQTFTFYIIDAGSTVINHIELEDAKDNSALKSAFSKFDASNSTIFITSIEDTSSQPDYSYQKIYLDGENAYVKYYEPDGVGSSSALNAKYDYLLTENPNLEGRYEARGYDEVTKTWLPSNRTLFGNIDQDRYTYNDFVPTLSGLSTDLFTYDSENNVYVCDNAAAIDIATNTLMPKATELQNINAKNATSIEISLNTNNTIKTVTINYSYLDFFSETLTTNGRIVIRYQDLGTTVIPFNALDNLGD